MCIRDSIKKYQWTTIPLALHGVVVLTDGTKIDICIGEDESDPVFLVTDLLPHLSAKQNVKKLAEGVPAEKLNICLLYTSIQNPCAPTTSSTIRKS